MKLENQIRQKLEESLEPSYLDIVNESYRHKGHSGYAEESHFHLVIASAQFEDLSTLASHRLIYEILKEELNDKVHALSIDIINEKRS